MEPITPPPITPLSPAPQRHGCLTAWLIFMIVANSFSALATPFSGAALARTGVHMSVVTIALLVICAVANIACAVALLRFQKWGFYGAVVVAVIALGINVSMGFGVGTAVFGLVGIAILYGVLNIGGPEKAWPRLR